MDSFADWMKSSGITIILIVLVVSTLRRFGNIIIRRTIRKAITVDNFLSENDRKQREDTLVGIVTASARVALWIIAGMLIIQELGVDIAPLLAGASIIGVALGFGAQSIVKDFLSGLFITLENQYRVGDSVEIADTKGVVKYITLRSTVLRNLDGHEIHVPNGLVNTATNKTMEFSAINLNLGVSYDADIDKVEKIIDEVGVDLSNDEKWTEKIIEAPHFVRISNFGASEVEIKVLGKVMAGEQWAVAGEFRRRIKKAFDKHKIEIPFPQVVVHKEK